MLPEGTTFEAALRNRGISRRRFLQFCGVMAGTLALPPRYGPPIAEALMQPKKPVLVWLEFQDCAGNSESMLRSPRPDVAEIVLETLSWEYHELIMAGAGAAGRGRPESVVREEKGNYLAVVEGAIPTGADGGVLHDRRSQRARHRAPGVRERRGDAGGRGVRVGRRLRPARADGCGRRAGGGSGREVVNLGGCPHNSPTPSRCWCTT